MKIECDLITKKDKNGNEYKALMIEPIKKLVFLNALEQDILNNLFKN